MTLTFGKKLLPEGLNVCINYEFNLLEHVGVVAKAGGVRWDDKINMATVASFSVAHENDNTNRFADTEDLYIRSFKALLCIVKKNT